MALVIDRRLEDADWSKQTWALPPYKSAMFMLLLAMTGMTLERFRRLPVYRAAVEQGLIKDDRWVGEAGAAQEGVEQEDDL